MNTETQADRQTYTGRDRSRDIQTDKERERERERARHRVVEFREGFFNPISVWPDALSTNVHSAPGCRLDMGELSRAEGY